MVKFINKNKKKRSKRAFALAMSACALLTFGCGTNTSASAATGSAASEQSPTAENSAAAKNTSAPDFASSQNTQGNSGAAASASASEIFTDRDFDTSYDAGSSVSIRLNGSSAQCSSNAVEIDGSNVIIKDEGTYIVSGTTGDGSLIVNVDDTDKVQIVLDGADITSKTSAPLYIKQADKVFVTLADGSSNSLANGGSFEAVDENNIDAVIFSKEDITLNGNGSLTIASPAGHGIVSKDSLRITSGSYEVSSASHSLDGNDEVSIANAELILTAGKDGIHAENTDDASLGFVAIESGTFTIDAQEDAVDSSSTVQINGGTFDIISGGGYENASVKSSGGWGGFPGGGMQRGNNGVAQPNPADNTAYRTNGSENAQAESTSMKGIKASQVLIINDGDFTLNCADDAFHSNDSAAIRGGTFEIATGDDAFHADRTISISDGNINITRSYEGIEGQTIEISGGTVTLYATDDGLNAAGGMDSSGMTGGRDGMFGPPSGGSGGSIVISGGTIDITAYGDGIDSNGSLDITGGDIVVSGPTQGDTSTLDTDGSSNISGGTFIGTGAANQMAQTFRNSEQGVISISVNNASAGTKIELADSAGNVILSHTPQLDFALVILSSPDIVSGDTYTLTVGNQSGRFTAG